MMNKTILKLAAVAMLAASAVPAGAQESPDAWPTRPITLVVTFAAGGPVDTVARIMGAYVGDILGQQMVVENAGGAGGMTGTARTAKAAPDGYTVLLSGSAIMTQIPNFRKHMPYDPIADFEHVALFADSARVLIARKDFPANNFKEFVAYAKSHQSTLRYGSAGAGSGSHTCALLLDGAMGTKITHVPYRGAGPAMQDLISGRIDYMAEQISTAIPQIRAGTVKAFATLGRDRGPGLDELPTAGEFGLKGLDCGAWSGFDLPKGTPQAIVRKLSKATNQALDKPELVERFKKIGVVVPAANRRSPEYFTQFVKSEIERWKAPIKASGVSLD
ncbi:MAG: tripartite tricarboxylate transporter substrate binding protein BugD [Rhizobiales bacterium]|jgi:tripartite-type tricarboxylate transporter receptor subunit TctC|nr:tripartite tricarboxylate transporter substrate binding protein BugD [Hyphomicrobiales bacterium]